MNLVDLNYNDLKEYSENIFNQMQEKKFYPDAIVIPLRGGLFLAQEILYFDENDGKNVDVFIINLKTYNDKTKGKTTLKQDFDFDSLSKYQNVLIVDDICDSGITIKFLKENIKNDNVKTAVLIDKTETCDFYGNINQSEDWIKFPWDN